MEKWLSKITDEAGVERIHQAVVKAEARTSCEIVPMIVRGSTTTGHLPLTLFLLIVLLGTLALPYIPKTQMGSWPWEALIVIVSWILSQLLSHIDLIHAWFTPGDDMRLAVDRRATHEFYMGNVSQTSGKNGVLVFVSLLEKRAVVLTDSAVASKLPKDVWNTAVSHLIDATKAGDFAGGMCAAIEELGARLESQFPRHAGDRNELSDLLVVKD